VRKYNLYITKPLVGEYEAIKENPCPTGVRPEDYWAECFTWKDLKKVVPFLKSRGWKIVVEPIEESDIHHSIHIFEFTYGINHDVKIVNISGMRIIMTRNTKDFATNKDDMSLRY